MVKNLGNNTVDVWLDGTQDYGQNRSNGNLFFKGKVLYSYGHHFPLAEKLEDGSILLNGDTYSVTTNGHQAWVRGAVHRRGLRYIIVPFSALPRELNRFSIRIIDVEQDREVPYPCRSQRPCHNWQGDGELMPPGHVHYRHLMGRSVFSATVEWRELVADPAFAGGQRYETFTRTAYYLSGLDETGKDIWRSYFLAELPRPVHTVPEALQALKPQPVLDFEADYQVDCLRQGEHFFIPQPGLVLRGSEPRIKKLGDFPVETTFLPHKRADREERHRATELRIKDDKVYVRGTVRHTGGDHKMLKLGKVWHEVHENTEVISYRPGPGFGKID